MNNKYKITYADWQDKETKSETIEATSEQEAIKMFYNIVDYYKITILNITCVGASK